VFRHRQATTRTEDPRELLDYFYQQQIEDAIRVRRLVSDRATQRKRVELQLGVLEQERNKLARQAEDPALSSGLREQLQSRIAGAENNLAAMQRQYKAAQELEAEGVSESWRRQEILNSFRTHKEGFKAEYGGLIAGMREMGTGPGLPQPAGHQITDAAAVKMAAITELLTPDLPDTDFTQSPDVNEG
jgi:phage shock protein A